MKSHRFSLLHPLLPAVALFAGLILVLSMTSARALPDAPAGPDALSAATGAIEGFVYEPDGTTPVIGARINMHHEEAAIRTLFLLKPDGWQKSVARYQCLFCKGNCASAILGQ